MLRRLLRHTTTIVLIGLLGASAVQAADAPGMRRYPVAGQEHFLADLGVAGFVRGPQAVQAQGKQVKGDKGQ